MQITSVRKRIPPRLPLHARSPGFTLLELMVAIAIFSLIAVMAYGGLNAVTKQSTILAEQELEIRRIQGGFRQIEADLFQIINRPVRDELGNDLHALAGGIDATLPLVFTRLGLPNPLNARRANLERIHWLLEDNQLIRLGWSPVDGRSYSRPETADSRQVLLENVEAFSIEFFDAANESSPTWPPANQPQAQLPRAIVLTVSLRNRPTIRLTFDVVTPVELVLPPTEAKAGDPSALLADSNNLESI